jgi:hypothetical protein
MSMEVLMTKFGTAGKTGPSSSYSGLSSFGNFQNKNMDGAKLEDLKIKGVLRPGKILKGIKGLR